MSTTNDHRIQPSKHSSELCVCGRALAHKWIRTSPSCDVGLRIGLASQLILLGNDMFMVMNINWPTISHAWSLSRPTKLVPFQLHFGVVPVKRVRNRDDTFARMNTGATKEDACLVIPLHLGLTPACRLLPLTRQNLV